MLIWMEKHYLCFMQVHFIAIGGTAMHNLAIVLHKQGHRVSGSDDYIYEPSRSRLESYGLLPELTGWFPAKIHAGLDAVVLGMHARADNPELARARELGLKIYSFPEYLLEQTRNKRRIVVGGSHGKTTITAMVIHVLRKSGLVFDFMAGALLEGCETMIELHDESTFAVFEGDEYQTSAMDKRPKFHVYRPDVALLTGIAWDHINIYPRYSDYLKLFSDYVEMVPPDGKIIYYDNDPEVVKLTQTGRAQKTAYTTPDYSIEKGTAILQTSQGRVPLKVFGRHNMENIEAARLLCHEIGLSDTDFYKHIRSFAGAAKRMELVAENENARAYYDYAHSPDKALATIRALREQFPDKEIIAVFELFTFSSLSAGFLPHYRGTMDDADRAMIYYNPKIVEHRKLKSFGPEDVKKAFAKPGLEVYTDSATLFDTIRQSLNKNCILLLMSSGDFDGVDVRAFAKEHLG